jgi:PAS domain S-box-containing protein
MSLLYKLKAVVEVDSSLCVNCHMCISVCPVKYCNDGSSDYVTINPDTCIGCGACIEACTHDARKYIDDSQSFINAIIANEKIVAVSAPAAAASFPDRYLQLNSFLKEFGVEAVFDVSFGAELTVKSYVEHLNNNEVQTLIAQPCPAIVNYIELYKPELIKYLAPIDSPILHTIKMIKNFYPEYKDHKIAIISPCIAKKREFEETGLGDYNVGMQSLSKFLSDNDIDLSDFPKSDYDNPPAERAALFSSPGGLMKTAQRLIPDIEEKSRKIEGVNTIYHYLSNLEKSIKDGKAPLLIDCLSCENGCNQGPVTNTQNQSPDETDYWIKERVKTLKEKHLKANGNNPIKANESIESMLDKYWASGLYERTYINRWKNNKLKYPRKTEIKEIYTSLLKTSKEDIQNCSACGYNSCEGMATAIFNNLNRKENCHLYRIKTSDQSLLEVKKAKAKTESIIQTAQDGFVEVDADMIITGVNKSTQKIFKKSDIIGRSLYEFLDKKNKSILEQESKKRKHGEQSSYEIEFTRSDGTRIITLVSGSPMRNFETGEITGSFALITDISKLKQTEKELINARDHLEERVKERTIELNEILEEVKQQNEEILTQKEIIEDSEKRLNNILQMLPNAVFIIDKNNRVTFWNKQAEILTGYTSAQMLGRGEYEYAVPFYGEKRPMLIDLVDAPQKELEKEYKNVHIFGNILRVEAYVPALKGEKRFLIAAATKLYDSENNYIGAIEIIEDITENQTQKEKIERQTLKLEHQAKMMEEILIESEKDNETIQKINRELSKLSIAVSKTENAIIIMDKDGNFEWVNDAFTKTYGLTTEELINTRGKNIRQATNYTSIDEVLNQVMKSKSPRTYMSIEENAKSEKIYTQTGLTPILNEKNEISGLVAVNTDVTEMKKAEETLLQQKEEIESQRDTLINKNEEIELQNEKIREHRDILTAQKKEITDSIFYAQRIQNAVIPDNVFFDDDDTLIFFKPKEIVSGDFYYFNETENYKIMAAADCTGHGVPGAFMSMLGISFLNEILKTGFTKASDILEELRREVIKALKQDKQDSRQKDGMDIALCLINKNKPELQYAGAYNPLIIIRNNEIIEQKAVRNPIGIYMKEKTFVNNTFELQKDDMVYIFSDGYADQFGGKHERKFTSKRFKKMLSEIAPKSINEQKEILESTLASWQNKIPQTDDIIVLGIKIR